MARVTMLAMHRDGLIVLPPPKGRQYRPKPIVLGHDTEPPLFPAPTTLDDVRPLDLRTVVRDTREGKRWNEFIARYHYLGYKTLVGAQMRYAVHDRNGWALAMLGFSTAAWKLAPRDHFIGWTPRVRENNLPLVVDNPRFLILPWITIPNLGSHILAIVRRRLPQDWTERYHTTPVLIETFVDPARFHGTVYRAANWVEVGRTRGFRRQRRGYSYREHACPKRVFVYALSRTARTRLRAVHLDPHLRHGAPKMMLSAAQMRSLPAFFHGIDDPRRRQGRRHALATVLALATAATLCGMRGYKAISEWVDDLGPKALERFGRAPAQRPLPPPEPLGDAQRPHPRRTRPARRRLARMA